jgi:ferredoxin
MPQLAGPTDPAADARWTDVKPRKGFFTDTSICIGCKACEVACKEWNHNPRDGDLELLRSSYDNTGALGASTWRHVAFVEQGRERIDEARATGRALVDLGMPAVGPPSADGPAGDPALNGSALNGRPAGAASASRRRVRPAAPWSVSACPAWAPPLPPRRRRTTRLPRTRRSSAG